MKKQSRVPEQAELGIVTLAVSHKFSGALSEAPCVRGARREEALTRRLRVVAVDVQQLVDAVRSADATSPSSSPDFARMLSENVATHLTRTWTSVTRRRGTRSTSSTVSTSKAFVERE